MKFSKIKNSTLHRLGISSPQKKDQPTGLIPTRKDEKNGGKNQSPIRKSIDATYTLLVICQLGVISFLAGAYFHSVLLGSILFVFLFLINRALINSLTYARYSIGILSLGWFFVGFLWGMLADIIFSTTFIGVFLGIAFCLLSAYLNGFLFKGEVE